MEEKELVLSESKDGPPREALGEFSHAVLKLISELAPCSEEKLFIAAATRKLRGSGNWPLLRLKQEIHGSVRQLADQGLVEINEQEISVIEYETEHLAGYEGVGGISAPPLDEILGSIRKIIRDNETTEAHEQTENEGLEREADNLDVEYGARVLNSVDAEPANEDEEIMDLTGELGGLELVEEEPEEPLETAEVADAALPELDASNEVTEELLELDEVQCDVTEPDVLELEAREFETIAKVETVELAEFVEPFEMEAPQEEIVEPEMPPMAPPQKPRQAHRPSVAPVPSPGQWASARLARARPRAGKAVTSATPSTVQTKSRTSQSQTEAPGTASTPAMEPAPTPIAAYPMPSPTVEAKMPPMAQPAPQPTTKAALGSAKLSASEAVASELEHAVAALKTASQSPSASLAPDPAAQSAPASKADQASAFSWSNEETGETISPTLGWLVENFPRRMRAHIPVEAEVRVSSSMTDNLPLGLVGSGETVIHEFEVAQAMSLKLSAPKGGFIIESQSPETQWVWRDGDGHADDCLASWHFTVTPTKRGPNVLRLTFSYKEVAGGIVADSTMPDKVLDIVVATNFGRTFAKVAGWFLTLAIGAALGAYFQSVELAPLQRIFPQPFELFHDLGP